MLNLSQFDYHLPPELIANQPADPRDSSKLMVINRQSGEINHHIFSDLPKLLKPSDVLVFNQTKVFPARLLGRKETGGKVELLLLNQITADTFQVISRPGLKIAQQVNLDRDFSAEVIEILKGGEVVTRFNLSGSKLWEKINQLGHTPIPPYIHYCADEQILRKQYQTVYARQPGSAAAPTAGLHFTDRLLKELEKREVQLEFLTLHVGLGTFKPVTEDNLRQGTLHRESYLLTTETATRLNKAKSEGRRIIAIGTTSARVLESCTVNGKLQPGEGETDIFIQPPYGFKFVDGLITNFHLPKSSLLMLVSAFVSRPNTRQPFVNFQKSLLGKAYQEAINRRYRFFSFGDATFIT